MVSSLLLLTKCPALTSPFRSVKKLKLFSFAISLLSKRETGMLVVTFPASDPVELSMSSKPVCLFYDHLFFFSTILSGLIVLANVTEIKISCRGAPNCADHCFSSWCFLVPGPSMASGRCRIAPVVEFWVVLRSFPRINGAKHSTDGRDIRKMSFQSHDGLSDSRIVQWHWPPHPLASPSPYPNSQAKEEQCRKAARRAWLTSAAPCLL